MIDMDPDDYYLYLQAELTYKAEFPDMEEDELYPSDWYSSRDYRLKIHIIVEAIKKHILIRDTDLYNENFPWIR